MHILNDTPAEAVVYGNSNKAKSFSLDLSNTAKALDHLSNTLYSDKVASIIRELSSNAADSHRAANKEDIPFKITLPTDDSPVFKIRDYGTGLCENDVFDLYTQFFKSTKDQSNDELGAFGLGSKTPFAYTDTFTVTSWFDGVKSIYTCFKEDKKQLPKIILMSKEQTTEDIGLEIAIPVMINDIDEFIDKTIMFFSTWGSTFPTITSDDDFIKISNSCPIVEPEVEALIETDIDEYIKKTFTINVNDNENPFSNELLALSENNWSLFNLNPLMYNNWQFMHNQTAFYIRIDKKVVYEIDPKIVNIQINSPFKVMFDVNIGDVDVSISRESLSYNKTTIDHINSLIKQFYKDIVPHAKKLLKTRLEALSPLKYHTLSKQFARNAKNKKACSVLETLATDNELEIYNLIHDDTQGVLTQDHNVYGSLAKHLEIRWSYDYMLATQLKTMDDVKQIHDFKEYEDKITAFDNEFNDLFTTSVNKIYERNTEWLEKHPNSELSRTVTNANHRKTFLEILGVNAHAYRYDLYYGAKELKYKSSIDHNYLLNETPFHEVIINMCIDNGDNPFIVEDCTYKNVKTFLHENVLKLLKTDKHSFVALEYKDEDKFNKIVDFIKFLLNDDKKPIEIIRLSTFEEKLLSRDSDDLYISYGTVHSGKLQWLSCEEAFTGSSMDDMKEFIWKHIHKEKPSYGIKQASDLKDVNYVIRDGKNVKHNNKNITKYINDNINLTSDVIIIGVGLNQESHISDFIPSFIGKHLNELQSKMAENKSLKYIDKMKYIFAPKLKNILSLLNDISYSVIPDHDIVYYENGTKQLKDNKKLYKHLKDVYPNMSKDLFELLSYKIEYERCNYRSALHAMYEIAEFEFVLDGKLPDDINKIIDRYEIFQNIGKIKNGQSMVSLVNMLEENAK